MRLWPPQDKKTALQKIDNLHDSLRVGPVWARGFTASGCGKVDEALPPGPRNPLSHPNGAVVQGCAPTRQFRTLTFCHRKPDT